MKFDFDTVIDRSNTYSIKYDAVNRGKPADILPMWVADMDFKAPPCVIEALEKQSSHGVFGYSDSGEGYNRAVKSWFKNKFDWDVENSWLIKTPGVVTAIHIAILALTQPGEGIIIQQPVYYPFASAVKSTGRSLVVNELQYTDGRYTIDFEDFEQKIKESSVKLFVLCSPHNPVGRVWKREELERLGKICLEYGVIVIADEIHQDFVYEGHKHQVFADISPELRDITVTCTAPSKTFNLAGLQISNIFIPNKNLRQHFVKQYTSMGLSQTGVMGIVACQAAYEGGAQWLEQLKIYLAGNRDYVRDFLSKNLPRIKLVEPEGTYLLWLDFSALGIEAAELDDIIINRAKLWLDDGPIFGQGGEGFQRINIACPRATLTRAMESLGRIFAD